MYRFDQQLRSIYYTVSQATVLNATAIFWNKDLDLTVEKAIRERKETISFIFLVFFKVNRILLMTKVVLRQKKLNDSFFQVVQTHRNSLF